MKKYYDQIVKLCKGVVTGFHKAVTVIEKSESPRKLFDKLNKSGEMKKLLAEMEIIRNKISKVGRNV